MKTVHVSASKAYDVVIGRGVAADVGRYISELRAGGQCLIVTDSNVAPLHLGGVRSALQRGGLQTREFVIPAGEASKNVDTYLSLIGRMAELGMNRSDTVVALGGGVVGDLAGFAAATYMRGTGLVMLPTTLLACVDSSVGGKTAVDLPQGKNLLGAFYQPDLVLCDTALLDSLPSPVFAEGCAEVIKYGMIGSSALLDLLEADVGRNVEEIIHICVQMKRDIVQADEFDRGTRRLLNLGHTFGHAIEAESGYRLSHGSCVGIGMAMITRAAVRRGLCTSETETRLWSLLQKCALPTNVLFTASTIADRSRLDKKVSGDGVTLVVPERIGSCRLMKVSVEELYAWAADGSEA